jgi:hypothetical protein
MYTFILQPPLPPVFAYSLHFSFHFSSAAEVEQNNANKKRTKGSSPNLEDFLPSEKRAKFTKSHNTLVGQGRSLHFGDEKGTSGKGAAEEEDSDSDLEILREEAAREQASKAQQELQKRIAQDKNRGKAGGGAAAKGQPEETWNDRQLVARSRAWLNKEDEVQEDDDEIELLGGSSDEESPLYKKTNRRNQNEAAVPKLADDVEFQEEDNNVKSPEVIMIVAKDKNGNEIQCQVRRRRTFSKLFSAFALQAAKNVSRYVWLL